MNELNVPLPIFKNLECLRLNYYGIPVIWIWSYISGKASPQWMSSSYLFAFGFFTIGHIRDSAFFHTSTIRIQFPDGVVQQRGVW